MIQGLRVLHAVLGLAAIVICLSVLLLGPSATANATETLFNIVTGGHQPLTGAWPPTMDSELRFYAPFWGVYGGLLLLVAWDLPAKLNWAPPLAAMFFVGGVGRAISYLMVGAPHPVFSLLMAIELVFPLIVLRLWRAVTNSDAANPAAPAAPPR